MFILNFKMLDLNDITDTAVESFSLKRKTSLQLLVKLKEIENVNLIWMIKHSKGTLKKGLRKYQNSSKGTEEISSLTTILAIDENELREVESELIKSLQKMNL